MDTPGHAADFGERLNAFVDGRWRAAADRRTRRPHATDALCDQESLALGLKPIVVVNKVDARANPDKVINAAFDLFDKPGANEEQLTFPWCMPPGINGWSSLQEGEPGQQWGPTCRPCLTPFEVRALTQGQPSSAAAIANFSFGLFQLCRRIGGGRISQGTLRPMMDVLVMEGPQGKKKQLVASTRY